MRCRSRTRWTTTGAALLIASAVSFSARAEASKADAAQSVGLFDLLCYSTMPDIAAVEAHATEQKWQALTGKDLDAFRPAVETDLLRAWAFDDNGTRFQVTITQSPMDDQSKAEFPAYAEATNYACSLVLPAGPPASAEIGAEMEKLLERKPDEVYEDGPWKVSAWSGATAEIMVLLYHYAPKSGAPGGLLSMTVFQNQ